MKKQIFPLLISLGFLCSFFVVQAAGELQPVQPGRGYLFDGVNDYVSIPSQGDLSFTVGEAKTIKLDAIFDSVAATKMILSKDNFGDGTDKREWAIGFFVTGKIRFYIKGDAAGATQMGRETDAIFTTGTEYSLEFRYDGGVDDSAFQIWSNGIRVDTTIAGGDTVSSIPVTDYPVYIGRRGISNYFAGKLSNIRFYDLNNKLLHSWHCDEGSGTTSFDSVREWKGTELVTNGGFDSSSNWIVSAQCSISGGVAHLVSSDGSYQSVVHGNVVEVGKRYNISFDVSNYVTGSARVRVNDNSSIIPITANGHYSYEQTATQTAIYIERNNACQMDFDNISIKELHSPAHGTITNATPATFHTTDTNFKSYQNEVGYSEVENLARQSENFSDAVWKSYVVKPVIETGHSAPDGTDTAVQFTMNNLTSYTGIFQDHRTGPENLTVRVWLKSLSGDTTYTFGLDDGVAHTITVTGEWQQFEFSGTTSSVRGRSFELFKYPSNNEKLLIWHPQTVVTGSMKLYATTGATDVETFVPVALDQNSNPTMQDIYGNDAMYTGRTRTKAELVGKNVAVFDGVDDYVLIPDSDELDFGTTDFSVSTRVKYTGDGWTGIVDKGVGAADGGWALNVLSATAQISARIEETGGSEVRVDSVGEYDDGKWHDVVATFDRDGYVTLYIDGAYNNRQNISSVGDITTTYNLNIGKMSSVDSYYLNGAVSDVRIYNRALSSKEVEDLYNGKAVDSGLVAAYPLAEGAGTTVYDTVPTYYGDDLLSPLNFTTNWEALSSTSVTNHNTFVTTTTGGLRYTALLTAGKKYKIRVKGTTTSSYARLTGISTAPIYIDNLSGSFDELIEITVDVGKENLYIRNVDAGTTTIELFSVQEVHEPANGTVTNADLDTFWATDMDAEDQNLVNGYTPGLINTTGGTAYKENKQAYGTWEFDLYKNATANVIFIPFIADRIDTVNASNGYYIASSGNIIVLARNNVGSHNNLLVTADPYIDINTWYRIKIQRNQTLNQYHTGAVGSFAVYIKGGDFGGEYVLVDVTGGLGSNPVVDNTYTTSAYSVLDLDAGDQVAGFMANNKIVDFHSFTEGTGKYDKLSLPAQSGYTAKDINNDRLTYVPQNLRNSAMAYKNVGVFDGVDDYIGLSEILPIYDKSFTISMWVNHSVAANRAILFGDYSVPGGNGSMNLEIGTSNQLRFWWAGSPNLYGASTTIPVNEWVHVTFVRDKENDKVYSYVDAVKDIDYSGAIIDRFPTSASYLGRDGRIGDTAFEGSISDFRVYDRVLSAADIGKLYQGQPISTNGLVAHYPLSEGAGTTVYNTAPDWYGPNRIIDGNGNWGDTDSDGLADAWITHRPANQFSILTDSYGRYQHVVKNTENLCSLAQSNVVQTEGGRTYKLTLKYRSDGQITDGTSGYNHDTIPSSATPTTVERIISGGTGSLTTINFFGSGSYMDIYSVKLQEIHRPGKTRLGENKAQNWNFTSGWSNDGGMSIDDNNSFSTSGSGSLWYTYGLTPGDRYRVRIAGTVSGGNVSVQDGRAGAITLRSYENETFDETFTYTVSSAPTLTGALQFTVNTSGVTCDISTLTLEKIYSPAHGTLTNTTPAAFWQIDNTVPFSQSYREGFSQGLVNTTAGTAYTPSDVAYGEWEFDVYKAGDANTMSINFISKDPSAWNVGTNESYLLYFNNVEGIGLVKGTAPGSADYKFKTADSYISNNTWYRIKVTRSTAGVFTVYIKGGSFGDDYVLMDVTGGSGANPVTDNTYTISNYFVAGMNAGDQIANVQIDGHRASVHEFEFGTGAYDKLFIPSQTGRGMDVLGSVRQIMGQKANSVFTATDLAFIAAQKLARAGINYWDATTKKFFTGRADGSLADFVIDTTYRKTTSELATINTNQTADDGHNYWDTTLRKFFRGLADGTLVDFLTWYLQ